MIETVNNSILEIIKPVAGSTDDLVEKDVESDLTISNDEMNQADDEIDITDEENNEVF